MALGKAAAGVIACLAIGASAAEAGKRTVEDVESVTRYQIERIKSSDILFNDHSRATDSSAGPAPGLIRFDEWSRTRPDERRLLGLYPGYLEPPTIISAHQRGDTKPTMYVAEARFTLDRAVQFADITGYPKLSFAENVDPAIKHRIIQPAEVAPLNDPKVVHNRNLARPWCAGSFVICLRSHYRLEGKLPLGVRLANKLREAKKKIADYLEFESELAARAPEEIDQEGLKRLARLDTPIIGTLEQSTFYINQVLQFGKSVVVFQRHPSQPEKTVVTAFLAVAIESKPLNTKKEYAKVPVLRNLVPVQVLMGKSSFNTGTSISAGLPNYARSRIEAMARILDGD